MARVLLVDDDRAQLDLRRQAFELSGYEVSAAPDAKAARDEFAESAPRAVVMDLRLPDAETGLALVREFEGRTKVAVLSGWPADLEGKPEARMIDEVLTKPVRMERLLAAVARLLIAALAALELFAQSYPFRVIAPETEVSATLELSGKEGALAEVRVDKNTPFHVTLFEGTRRHSYPVFLGRLRAGEHSLEVRGAEVHAVKPAEGDPLGIVRHAPVLFARENTLGRFTDIPLVMYAERLSEAGSPVLQYTVIFSNEDGGTSTRALMARWGRTTDIEYVYKVYLNGAGERARATIQARGHREIEFEGPHEGDHPLLIPVTDNNMVSGEARSPVRYQIAPFLADLRNASREQTMDERAWMYRVASQELEREGKIRPFGVVDGQKISDPRNYLYIEALVENRDAAVAAFVRLKGERVLRSSHLGREDYAIERSGWVRTTVELPPGTRANQIEEIGFTCLVVRPAREKPLPVSGTCRVERVSKAFLLDRGYKPGGSIWSVEQSVEIPSGVSVLNAAPVPR